MGAGCRQQQKTPAEAEEWAESPNFLSSPSSGVCDYPSMLGLTKILPSGGERLTRVVYRHPKTASFMNNLANRWCSGTMFNKIPSAAVAFAKLKQERRVGNAEPEPVTAAASRCQTELKPVETNAKQVSCSIWPSVEKQCGEVKRRVDPTSVFIHPLHPLQKLFHTQVAIKSFARLKDALLSNYIIHRRVPSLRRSLH